MSSSSYGPEIFGADPVNIKWSVVRGDTASITVNFLDDDEVTPYNITTWDFIATAYDKQSDVVDILTVTKPSAGTIIIKAPASITKDWGTGYRSKVTELMFDVQVTINGATDALDVIWTPIIGTISVLGDVTFLGGAL
jgi:hypothetical protein